VIHILSLVWSIHPPSLILPYRMGYGLARLPEFMPYMPLRLNPQEAS
jgi:hypothetical protein